LVFCHHSNGAGTDFRRKFVRRFACHRPYFSRVGVSGKAGAVQFYNLARPHGAFNGKAPYEILRERL
ncbi:hypothetical protein GB927_016915, partial [Shinella sp. CPCC 100929]